MDPSLQSSCNSAPVLTKAESEKTRRLRYRSHGPVQDVRLYDQPQLEFTVQSVLCME